MLLNPHPHGDAVSLQLHGPRVRTLLSLCPIDLEISAPLSHPQEPAWNLYSVPDQGQSFHSSEFWPPLVPTYWFGAALTQLFRATFPASFFHHRPTPPSSWPAHTPPAWSLHGHQHGHQEQRQPAGDVGTTEFSVPIPFVHLSRVIDFFRLVVCLT